jgi:protein-tyrosine-phosphatase
MNITIMISYVAYTPRPLMIINILFVCAANANRSPTFEKYFREAYPELEFKSSGVYAT